MRKSVCVLVIAFLCCVLQNVCFGFEEKKRFENTIAYRHEISSDKAMKILLNRLTLRNLAVFEEILNCEFYPFAEVRWDFEIEESYLNSVGGGLRFTINEHIKFATNLQYTWIDVPDGYFKNPQRLDRDKIEVNPILNIILPIHEDDYGFSVKAIGFNEYYYDIKNGIPVRNEVGITFMFGLIEQIDVGLGWRHLDWVKDADSDQVELIVTVNL